MTTSSDGQTVTGPQSLSGSSAPSPTRDNTQRAIETLIAFIGQSMKYVDRDAYMAVIDLGEKLCLQLKYSAK